jgi:hypothetical protein
MMPTEQDFLDFLDVVTGLVRGPDGPASFESRLVQKLYLCERCGVVEPEQRVLAHLEVCR